MSYTSSPVMSTYGTKTIPVAYDIDFRLGTAPQAPNVRRDAGLLNLIPRSSPGQQEFDVENRPALYMSLTVASGLSSPTIRGAFLWETGTTHLVAVDNKVYYSSDGGTTWATLITWTTAAYTPIGFAEFIDATNTKKLIIVDGVEGYVCTLPITATKITDADFPTPHQPFPVVLDGYLFLAKKSTGDIYNSDLNNPASWTAGSYISSELYPDNVQALVRVDNYVLAIGTTGSEFFYDAANATGSPLARYEGGVLPFGTDLPYTVAASENMVFMLATDSSGEMTLKYIEGLKYVDITPEWMSPYFNTIISNLSTTNAYRVKGTLVRLNGDLYYTLRAATTNQTVDYGYFVYSIKHKFWTEWCGNNYGPFPAYAFSPSINGASVTSYAGLSSDNTKVHYGSTVNNQYSTCTDVLGSSSYNFPVEIRTTRQNFDTLNLKMMNRVGIEMVSTATSTISLTVATSDDDGLNWSSDRALDATQSTNFPFVTQLGAFRQRQLKFKYSGASAVRFKGIHIDLNKGQQ